MFRAKLQHPNGHGRPGPAIQQSTIFPCKLQQEREHPSTTRKGERDLPPHRPNSAGAPSRRAAPPHAWRAVPPRVPPPAPGPPHAHDAHEVPRWGSAGGPPVPTSPPPPLYGNDGPPEDAGPQGAGGVGEGAALACI